MQWFYRESSTAPLQEALDFRQVEILARKLSRINTTGIIETVVLDAGVYFVHAIFLRGRKLRGGKHARDSSKLGLPPKI